MDEAAARRIVLAQAIETTDTEGKLLSTLEREQIDRIARQAAPHPDGSHLPELLDQRAQRVLQIVQIRNPQLAALQHPRAWQRWLAPGALLAALLLGAATDRIANPHRVDLLSLPLLAILGWNVAVYVALWVGWAHGGRRSKPRLPSSAGPPAAPPHEASPTTVLRRWLDGLGAAGRGAGRLPAKVAASFFRHWHAASLAIHGQRWKKVLHFAAAGWGLGVMLSLFLRGLVVEYRVGWESTFLDAEQVHAILRVLLAPAVLLFPFEPFSVQEVARLQFAQGQGAIAGARWVYLYATLLALVVVLPRLLLGWLAHRREAGLSRRVVLDLAAPYFQELLARLQPARIRVSLAAEQGAERDAVLRMLASFLDRPLSPQTGSEPLVLIRSGSDDTLLLEEGLPAPAETATPSGSHALVSWTGRLLGPLRRSLGRPEGAEPRPAAGPTACSIALHVAHAEAEVRDAAGHKVAALALHDFTRCWVQHPALFQALAPALPAAQRPALARLAEAWAERNAQRLRESMAALAAQLAEAAQQMEEVRSAPLSVLALVRPGERRAGTQAREEAMAALAQRLEERAAQTHAELLRLHGIAADAVRRAAGQTHPVAHFAVQEAVDAPQAGMAGAATGAAMGASVDLVTGGLTLGAAAALGALAGGSAAWAAAAWKNRSAPAGTGRVQAGDTLLLALAEAALLGYVAVVHFGTSAAAEGADPASEQWRSEIAATVPVHRLRLEQLWAEARAQKSEVLAAREALARELEAMALEVLGRLYPAAPA